MSVPDDLVADFVSITGADAQTAQGLLQVTIIGVAPGRCCMTT